MTATSRARSRSVGPWCGLGEVRSCQSARIRFTPSQNGVTLTRWYLLADVPRHSSFDAT